VYIECKDTAENGRKEAAKKDGKKRQKMAESGRKPAVIARRSEKGNNA
jgi:hypothetical protein